MRRAAVIGAVAAVERVSENGPYVEPRGDSPLMPAIVEISRAATFSPGDFELNPMTEVRAHAVSALMP